MLFTPGAYHCTKWWPNMGNGPLTINISLWHKLRFLQKIGSRNIQIKSQISVDSKPYSSEYLSEKK